ncbi:hypothetical protein [Amycolatopsis methanolica]|uniref:hypothetical protein n=1 Tax=Amycolatopsis methanolica TaxID=1814 RepID=UPI003432B6B9
MSLDTGHTVYSNAKAVLSTKAPLNVMFVSLDPGGPPGTPLPANDTVPVSQTKRVIQPSELLSKLDERTRDALQTLLGEADTALANAPAQLPDGLRATDATVNAFRPVVEQLQTRRGTISKLVTSLSQISTAAGHDDGRLADLVASLQQTLSVLSQRDTELSGTLSQIPGFSDDQTHAMGSVRDLTGELNPTLDGLRSASTTLPPALSRVTGMVDRAGPLVAAAKPVVSEAKPVVVDLRPLAGDVHTAFDQLAPVTGYLPSATGPWPRRRAWKAIGAPAVRRPSPRRRSTPPMRPGGYPEDPRLPRRSERRRAGRRRPDRGRYEWLGATSHRSHAAVPPACRTAARPPRRSPHAVAPPCPARPR